MKPPTVNPRTAKLLLAASLLAVALPRYAAEPTAWEKMLDGAPPQQLEEAFRKEIDANPADAAAAYGLALLQQAAGEREKAVVTAVEGLRNGAADPTAFLLEDLISDDAAFDLATTRLVSDSLPLLRTAQGMDPEVRFNLAWLAMRLDSRKGDLRTRREAAASAGFIPGAYFSEPLTVRPRLAFYEDWPAERGKLGTQKWTYYPTDGPEVRPPLYAMAPDRESEYLVLVPFTVAKDTQALLYVNTSKSFRLSLDDKQLVVKDVFKVQEDPTVFQRVLLKAGAHRIVIKIHAQRAGDGLHLALLAADGTALPVSWEKGSQPPGPAPAGFSDEGRSPGGFESRFPASDPRREAFLALWNRWEGDVATARVMMDEASRAKPKCLAWNLWSARMYLFEADDLPTKIAQSRAERSVDDALQVAPEAPMALFYQATLQSASSDSDDFLVTLRKLAKDAPADPRWSIALAQRLTERGWYHQARAVLRECSSYHPDCESVESAWVAFYRRLPDPRSQADAIRRLSALRNADPEWEDYYEATRQYAELKKVLEGEIQRFGDRDLLLDSQIARLEIRMGEYASARARLEKLAGLNPDDPDTTNYLARACFLMGDREAGMKAWDALKKAKPDAFQVDMAQWVLGSPLPFQDRHLSLSDVERQEKGRPVDASPSSLLLDQMFTRVLPDGSSIERYHSVVRINNKEGVDREGEQSLPGQIVLTLRTVKPDGTVLEPEQIPDKDTISMQGLEPGDLVEAEYITLKPPSQVKRDAYITSQVFLFQDIEKPFHHTQWFLEYPASMPMKFYEQNLPAPAQKGTAGAWVWRNWEYRDMPRIAPEPDTPSKQLFLPMVEAVGGITWKDVGLYLKEGATGVFQLTPELQARYADAVKGASTPGEKLKAIEDYLLKNIDGERPASWQDPTQSLLTRQGSRLPVAGAFLRLADIPFRVLVAEAVPDNVYRDDLPRLGQFSIPVLEADLPGKAPQFLTLGSPYRDPDVLPWYLQGARAMAVTDPEPWKVLKIPSDMSPWERASERETRELLADGDMRLVHDQTMDPEGAENLRSSFHKIEKDQLKRAIQVALSKQYGSADLEDYSVEGLDDARAPLVWKYTVLIHGYASVDGSRLTVADPLPSLQLGQNLASLSERKLPLTTGGPIFVNQKIVIELPKGAKLDYTVPQLQETTPFGSYLVSGERSDERVTLERKLRLPYQVVWPKDYGAFSAFLRKVDRVEGGQMTVTLP